MKTCGSGSDVGPSEGMCDSWLIGAVSVCNGEVAVAAVKVVCRLGLMRLSLALFCQLATKFVISIKCVVIFQEIDPDDSVPFAPPPLVLPSPANSDPVTEFSRECNAEPTIVAPSVIGRCHDLNLEAQLSSHVDNCMLRWQVTRSGLPELATEALNQFLSSATNRQFVTVPSSLLGPAPIDITFSLIVSPNVPAVEGGSKTSAAFHTVNVVDSDVCVVVIRGAETVRESVGIDAPETRVLQVDTSVGVTLRAEAEVIIDYFFTTSNCSISRHVLFSPPPKKNLNRVIMKMSHKSYFIGMRA
jgi:hypothetical protein